VAFFEIVAFGRSSVAALRALFWASLASGKIIMRKVDGWKTLSQKSSAQLVDLAP
jgi:putative transposase